jgi:hypothetical protein
MKMSKTFVLFLFLLSFSLIYGQDTPNQILIKNVNVFDGKSDALLEGVDILIEGNLIKQLGKNITAPDAMVIDGNEKVASKQLTED